MYVSLFLHSRSRVWCGKGWKKRQKKSNLVKSLDGGLRACYNAYLRGQNPWIFLCVKDREGRAVKVFLASDADPAITGPVAEACAAAGIPTESGCTMAELGKACRVSVGASVAALL